MSTDAKVTEDLIETLEDGKEGFAAAADRLQDSDRPDLASTFRQFSEQRAQFADELRNMAAAYGDPGVDDSGSVAGTLHRAWMAVKDTIAGSDPDGVLDAAEQGEDHAVSEYEKALGEDISANLRTVVERQLSDVKRAHATVRDLRNAATS